MLKFSLNKIIQGKQRRNLTVAVLSVLMVGTTTVALLSNGNPKKTSKQEEPVNLVGVVDSSFSDANAESALTAQQGELESLKTQIKQLQDTLKVSDAAHNEESKKLSLLVGEAMKVASTPKPGPELALNQTNTAMDAGWAKPRVRPRAQALSFRYDTGKKDERYVPSGTFVPAVILGGADADAGVNGQSKNNGVMLFKLVQNGTLPNGGHSRMKGCFVTGSAWGDVSSERAYVVLDKLSCARPGEPIIDRPVTGWAFFGGKVGIKGKPMMRDNKTMAWAGLGGIMSGISSAAQYTQSILTMSPLGAASAVPTTNMGAYTMLGGGAKGSDMLAGHFVRRAELFHPVIQVGAGNLVTIVFKDGFNLESEDETKARQQMRADNTRQAPPPSYSADNGTFNVPPEILNQIKPQSELSMNGANP